jgi:hypothetical protein
MTTAVQNVPGTRTRPTLLQNWPLIVFPATKLLIHLAALPGYGYFRDEFYYLACARRLAAGYVDHPPLSIFVLRIVTDLFGSSVEAIRVVPAVAGAGTVLLVGLMARDMGAGRFGQALAMMAGTTVPVWLALNHFYSMNALDLLLWALAAWLVIRILQRPTTGRWIALGVLLGFGLQNKISVLWLGAGLFAGLVVTSAWIYLHPRIRHSASRLQPVRHSAFPIPHSGSPIPHSASNIPHSPFRIPHSCWPWLAAAIALALFLPYIGWQIAHGWPTAEFMRNATSFKMVHVSVPAFAVNQVLAMNPFTAFVWGAGLIWLLFTAAGERYRPLGWAFIVIGALLAFSGTSRAYYLAPAYAWLFAAGGVTIEQLTSRWRVGARHVTRSILLSTLLAGGILLAPYGLPLLSAERFIAHMDRLGVRPGAEEHSAQGALPQFFADMHGWPAIVEAVDEAWETVPADEREGAVVFGSNYGVAGAIEHLGRERGLPPAISGHNNFWLWGPPDGEVRTVIVVGGERAELEALFEDVRLASTTDCGYCMPYENHQPVWVCRGLKVPLAELWPGLKKYV